jgi:hypothetical protein
MALVKEVVDWAIVNTDNIKPNPPSPTGRTPERNNLTFQQMMGSIARWRDDIDAAIAAGLSGSITDNQIAVGAATANEIEGSDSFTWDGGTNTATIGDGTASGSLQINALATENPFVGFYEAGVLSAFVQNSVQASNSFRMFSIADKLEFYSANSLALTLGINQDATFGSGSGSDPTVTINGSAASNPVVDFHQAGTQKAFIRYLDSGDIFQLAADGDIQFRPANVTALTLGISQDATFAGDVTCTAGAFTSRGIDDNATAERVNLSDTSIGLGDGSTSYTILQRAAATSLYIAGGTAASTSAYLRLYGTTGDFGLFAPGNENVIYWDESLGDLRLYAGTGVPTLTVNVDAVSTEVIGELSVSDAHPNRRLKITADATDAIINYANNNDFTLQVEGNDYVRMKDGGPLLLNPQTLTANSEHDVILFSNTTHTGAQSGAFYNKLSIYGGASQTRTLDLYQVPSGDAYIGGSFASNTLRVNNFGGGIVLEDAVYFGPEKDMYLTRGSTSYLDLHNQGGAGTVSGFRFYDQAVLGGYIRGSGSSLELRTAQNAIALQVTTGGTVSLYQAGVQQLITNSDGVGVGNGTVTTTVLDINATAAGNPQLQFQQNGTIKAYLQYADSGDLFQIDADGSISIRPANTERFRFTTDNHYSFRQMYFVETTLTDQAAITWDLNANQVSKVTLAGNRTLSAPTNMKAGATYILRVIQDGVGSRTLAYNSVFKWPGGTAPVLSTGAGDIDILTFVCDGTNMYGVAQLDFV